MANTPDTKRTDGLITLEDIRAMTWEQFTVVFPNATKMFTYHPELDTKKEKAK